MASSLYTDTYIHYVYLHTYIAYSHIHTQRHTHTMVNAQVNPTNKNNTKLLTEDPILPLSFKWKSHFYTDFPVKTVIILGTLSSNQGLVLVHAMFSLYNP